MTKILAIDDKEDNLIAISALLEYLIPECRVITAQSGLEGLQKAQSELPDTILLDIFMPVMDGYEVCRRLKRDTSVKHIPVIMLTAVNTDSQSRIRGLDAGAEAFLSKPVDEAELAAQVRAMLRIKRTEDRLRREKKALEALIEEKTAMEKKILASLKEKEILLREIHHRVKNNMAIITSMLNLQAGNIKEQKYIDMFEDCQNRIHSMALIHETLYRSEDLTNINFRDYIHQIAANLLMAYSEERRKVAIDIDMEDISMEIDKAIPCGLIVNELLTNAIKHGFHDSKEDGVVRIALQTCGNKEMELIVSDNGIGIPPGLDIRHTETLGLQLVTNLVEYQLRGKIYLVQDGKTEFHCQFRGEK
ncbi:MAG TPA: histidine kinase dimerization/phosphoacceptor domain -containing protein [Thermodesulfovibrionia bacterium]|nr:histidine kinase dimerization/phosphoacceptor domain -containing protein [Thermodesulfovibrionia bacterium]